ncbi:short coiled-coil protein [Drosophila grimshawi]|uniref:GH19516 n=1 Tax=Drosophila grimshawi TaxID=7222 RepID=B4JRU2_DROGR|nr:short coiled-coil protein [Drosophila grimshawi]EDV94482.1 GH19516 [Drosophila grimshawi]
MSIINNDDNIMAIDEDPQVIINDDEPSTAHNIANGRSMDSLRSSFTNHSSTPDSSHNSLDTIDVGPDDIQEKSRLITQVLELQNTLDDLSQRVDSVKNENLKLRSENQVLGQYIENLMSASSVFQSTSPSASKKK